MADRIAQGPIPLEEALAIAREIADALEAAHDKGIVHRDLKPANVKIRPDASVKVLDFGLAKSAERAEVTADSPTAMMSMSIPGVIMGTAGYMAPEQARGKTVDDIWAFGVVPKVYVQPFPGTPGGAGGKWLIGAGRHPAWSRNGREIFYFDPDASRVTVATWTANGDSFPADKSRVRSDRWRSL